MTLIDIIIISCCIVVFLFFFLKLNTIEKIVKKNDSRNEKFIEASLIFDEIEKKCNAHLILYPDMNQELKLACKRGISLGALFYKHGYLKKGYSAKYEQENIINIFKDVRSSVTFDNLNLTTDEVNLFKQELAAKLRKYAYEILDSIERFRNNDYNGQTVDKFILMATTNINNIVTIAYNTHKNFVL